MNRFTGILFSLLVITSCKDGALSSVKEKAQEQSFPELDYTTGFVAPESVPVISDTEQGIADAVTVFGMEIFDSILQDYASESVMYSPLSLSLALSMCLVGADGETETQLSSLLGFEGYDKKDVASYYKAMIGRLMVLDKNVSFLSANALWYDRDFSIKDHYLQTIGENFDASAFKMDFDEAKSLIDAINHWVSEKTQGTIKDIARNAPPKPMLFANALYFKAGWAVVFGDKLEKGVFYATGGKEEADFFVSRNSFEYSSADEYQIVLLPYGKPGEDSFYEMAVVLPKQGVDVKQTLKWIRGTGVSIIDAMDYGCKKSDVRVEMPCFKIESSLSGIRELLAVKCPAPFSGSDADFSGISDERIFISDIAQKTYIKVDEKGTEASAVTEIAATSTGESQPEPIVFRADHPFVFMIREKESKSNIFIGVKQ